MWYLICQLHGYQFFFTEADDLLIRQDHSSDRLRPSSAREELFDVLLRDFSALPKSLNKTDFDNYGVINVSPPVVPNPYLPTFRIFTYNITGIAGSDITEDLKKKKKKKGSKRRHGHRRGDHEDKKTLCKKLEYRDTWKCQLNEPWYSDPESPSRTNTLWSPLGYAQV